MINETSGHRTWGRLRVAAWLALASCGGPSAVLPPATSGSSPHATFEEGGLRLIVGADARGWLHVELAPAGGGGEASGRAIATTPMIADPETNGAPDARWTGRHLSFRDLEVDVAPDLCLDVKRAGVALGRFCPTLSSAGGRVDITAEPGASAFGLGQQCIEPGLSGGDWAGRVRPPGGPYGNKMNEFDGGACGDTQIPILYAVGRAARHFALFVDDARALTWDLSRSPWSVTTPSPAVRFYLLTGSTVAELRSGYMTLTGRPPVPPRAAFGMWVSEYGFDDWAELDGVLAGLRKHGFPVDGFVLDLQWFGGIREGAEDTSMGNLAFDPRRFPDAAKRIASLRADGVGIIPIEESYVGRARPEHRELAGRGFLARTALGAPVFLHQNPWWGKGGMIDWSNPAAGDAWHDMKRKALVDMGVVGHWIDLGEPEQFDPAARYHGFAGIGADQAAVHNLYNLAWAASIVRGYARQGSTRRPFILSRSGTAGIQRLGAAMWSGDVGSRYTTLATQQRNQLHMSMSGIDYYGSDVGGFGRAAFGGGDVDELYTQWFADAALTEVPLRPHTFNLKEAFETSPDRVGHRASNLANLRLRYQLVPYLYSLAHLAHRSGEPVFPPLFFHYPADPAVRPIGDQKLIGRDLLVALAAGRGQRSRRVYLPAGHWFEFRTGRYVSSRGVWLEDVPLYRGDRLELPLYARAGAIIPMRPVDEKTRSSRGPRAVDGAGEALALKVFSPVGTGTHRFTLVEDDGETTGYLRGEALETQISVEQDGALGALSVEVAAARGDFPGAPRERPLVVEIAGAGSKVMTVELDGVPLGIAAEGRVGWRSVGELLRVTGPSAPTAQARRLVVRVDHR